MAVRPLVMFPDPLLRQEAAEVSDFGPSLAELAADLLDTLVAVSAIGLAAPHIGVLRKVVAARLPPSAEAKIYVNPIVIWNSPESATHEEGSVSMPGIRERIVRPTRIRISFQTLDGDAREEEAADFPAAILLHEIDQLGGTFWIDRLSRLRRDRLLKRFAKRPAG